MNPPTDAQVQIGSQHSGRGRSTYWQGLQIGGHPKYWCQRGILQYYESYELRVELFSKEQRFVAIVLIERKDKG